MMSAIGASYSRHMHKTLSNTIDCLSIIDKTKKIILGYRILVAQKNQNLKTQLQNLKKIPNKIIRYLVLISCADCLL
jgi:GTP-sensing pleiotropic transcriptional regulator CodY